MLGCCIAFAAHGHGELVEQDDLDLVIEDLRGIAAAEAMEFGQKDLRETLRWLLSHGLLVRHRGAIGLPAFAPMRRGKPRKTRDQVKIDDALDKVREARTIIGKAWPDLSPTQRNELDGAYSQLDDLALAVGNAVNLR